MTVKVILGMMLLKMKRFLDQFKTRFSITSESLQQVLLGMMLMEKRFRKQLKKRLPILSRLVLQAFLRTMSILMHLQTRLLIMSMTVKVILGTMLRKKQGFLKLFKMRKSQQYLQTRIPI